MFYYIMQYFTDPRPLELKYKKMKKRTSILPKPMLYSTYNIDFGRTNVV